jgi:hypothetical protein
MKVSTISPVVLWDYIHLPAYFNRYCLHDDKAQGPAKSKVEISKMPRIAHGAPSTIPQF